MKHIIKILIVGILLSAVSSSTCMAKGKIIYINKLATGNNDGTSWKDAFISFDSVFTNLENNAQVWMAVGEYIGSGKIEWKLEGLNLSIYGGFLGYESFINQRHVQLNKTILNGTYHLNVLGLQDGNYYLDGLILEKGIALGLKIGPDTYDCEYWGPAQFSCRGGGINMYSQDTTKPCNLTIKNCIIRDNQALNGGGINIDSYPDGICGLILDSCIVSNNSAKEDEGGINISLGYHKQLPFKITNSIIENNNAFFGDGGINYWSIYDSLGTFEMDNCTIKKNYAKVGGGASIRSHKNAKSILRNCQFIENIGTNWNGGGIGALEMYFGMVINCSFINNIGFSSNLSIRTVDFKDCLFAKNRSYLPESNLFSIFEWGLPSPNETTNFYNCTFYDDSKGAKNLFPLIGQNVYFNNCAFDVLDSNLVLFKTVVDTLVFNNCSFNRESQLKKFTANKVSDELLKQNNTLWNVSPAFRDTMNNDFRLSSCSPLVNQGSNLYLGFIDSFDLAGAQRLQDGQLDIGAYETPKINYQFNSTPNLCATDSSGTFSIVVSGGIAPYQLNYNGEIYDTLTLNNIHSGLQSIILSDSTNCKLEIKTSFGPEPIHFDTIIVQASSKTSKDGTIKLSKIQGGNPPLNLLWSNGVNQVDSIINLAAGIYSVTITDSIGCEEYFSFQVTYPNTTISVFNKGIITLFPNPAKNQLTIELGEGMNSAQVYDIKLFNLQGSTLYKGAIPAYAYVHTIDVQNLASGMYILELSDREGKVLRRKFVKSSITN